MAMEVSIKNLALQGTGSGVFFLSFLLLFYLLKDRECRYKLLYPNIIIWALFENPFIVQIIWTRVLGYGVHRLANCIPIGFIIAFSISYFWNETNKKETWIFAIGIVFLMLLSADNINGDFKKAENLYGIPQDVIEVSELVLDEEEKPLLLVSMPDANFFRQYSSDVQLLFGEDVTAGKMYSAKKLPDVYYDINRLMNEKPLNVCSVSEQVAEFDVDYIVINKEKFTDVVNEDNQWYHYYSTIGKYAVYKRT